MTRQQEDAVTPEADAGQPRRRTPWANIVLVVASLLFAVLLAEVGARVYGAVADIGPRSAFDYRLTRPPPYEHSPYFSESFVREQYRQPGGYHTAAGSDFLVPHDFHGRFYNVDNGIRRTTGQPRGPRQTVLLFGGSTIYNAEVPDDLTAASSLQRLLEREFPGTYRVVNYGVDSANARQQLQRLKTVDIAPGDLVVFYDGDNEAYGGVYLNNPSGTIYQSQRRSYERSGPLGKLVYRLNAQLRKRSYLVRKFLTPPPELPSHVGQQPVAQQLAQETARVYEEALREAAAFSAAKGARFAHFLQPNLFTAPSLTNYEATLVDNEYLVFPGVKEAVRLSYPLLQATVAKLRSEGVTSSDLSSLDPHPPGREVYLDFAHVNEEGNAKIAEAIFAGVRPLLSPPTS
ncbi:MAG TPA: hypothetical protein VHG90_13865 [Acidimicrobiales bacterium]|nr:hypothetical protein [Acidimicrobiales bacterium]